MNSHQPKGVSLKYSILVTLVISLAFGWGGYELGRSKKKHSNRRRSVASKRYRNWNQTAQLEQDGRRVGSDSTSNFSDPIEIEYQAALKRNHLEIKDQKLSQFVSSTELGKSLHRTLTLHGFGNDPSTPERRIAAEDFQVIQAHPMESYEEIREILKRLGSEFESERQLLLQTVMDLDVELPSKTALLYDEMSMSVRGGDSKQNLLNSAFALSELMQLDANPEDIENALRPMIRNYDRASQPLLLNIYETKYPDLAKKLKLEMGLY